MFDTKAERAYIYFTMASIMFGMFFMPKALVLSAVLVGLFMAYSMVLFVTRYVRQWTEYVRIKLFVREHHLNDAHWPS